MNGEHPYAWRESDIRPQCQALSRGYDRAYRCRLIDEHITGHWFGIERVSLTMQRPSGLTGVGVDSASVSISNALVAWGSLWESQGMDIEQLDAELKMVDQLRLAGPDAVLAARLDRLELRLLRSKLARVKADRVSDVSQ